MSVMHPSLPTRQGGLKNIDDLCIFYCRQTLAIGGKTNIDYRDYAGFNINDTVTFLTRYFFVRQCLLYSVLRLVDKSIILTIIFFQAYSLHLVDNIQLEECLLQLNQQLID